MADKPIRAFVVQDNETLPLPLPLPLPVTVEWAADFADAKAKIARDLSCDVYVVDYELRGGRGLELVREVHARDFFKPILVLIGEGDAEAGQAALDAGALDVLPKAALDAATLERALRYAVAHAALLEKLASLTRLAAVGELAASVAHEIANPVMMIIGHAEKMTRELSTAGVGGDTLLRSAALIKTTTNRVAKLVRGMCLMARDSAVDAFESVPLRSIIDETLELCRERFCSSGVALREPEVPRSLFVHCRPAELSQVLLNLLVNALDAVDGCEERWVAVEVTPSAAQVDIAVVDSGRGIGVELRERIMRPFFTTKAQGKGTGLGLSIAWRIAADHGGTLKLDEGSSRTRFVLSLPLR